MSKRSKQKSRPAGTPQRESVFREAWENMNDDMARCMPEFLTRRLKGGRGALWVVVVVTLLELIVLGAVGKFLYSWLTS
jgi:hypothetical protein